MPGILMFLFGTSLGRYLLAALAGLFGAVAVWGMVLHHDHVIREQAVAQFNIDQKNLTDTLNKRYQGQIEALTAMADKESQQLAEDRAKMDKQAEDLNKIIDATKNKRDLQAVSPIIRSTLEALKKGMK